MTDPSTPQIPDRFADDARRYRLDSRIATGGMGEVWRATDTTLEREVAVKLLKQEYSDDATFRSRFETEAQHAAALHHHGVAGVYDFGEAAATDGSGHPRPFLVMELVDGKPLSDLLRGGRALDPEVARDLLAQAADAVAVAHRAGIVHRDIKPANLLVTPDRQIKITDFGIARAADGVGITQTGQVMGTPQYISPEQARGNPATTASDVYSLGVVAYECLVGRRPFDAESPIATALAHLQQPVPDLPDDVPADLAAVVQRALAKDPAERYPDAAAFAAALRDPATAVMAAPPPATASTQVLAGAAPVPVVGASPLAAPVDAPPVADEEDRRRSPWAALLAVLLVVAAAVIVFFLVTAGDDESEPPAETPTTSKGGNAQQVRIDAADYVGRPVDDVVRELEDLGLRVETTEIDNPGDATAGDVEDVDPTGRLRKGDLVEVTYWGEPVVDEEPEEPTEEPEPTQEPPPTEEPEPTEEPSPTPTEQPSDDPTPTEQPTEQPSETPPTPTTPTEATTPGPSSPAANADVEPATQGDTRR